jgi:hypothetical protein
MSEIKYIRLIKLINSNPNYIEKIKESYLLLLTELTITNYIETKLFLENIERINNIGTIFIGYIGDINNESFEIISSGTLIIEPKLIRDGKNVGHIEDIVVTKFMRGKGISQKILNLLKNEAREKKCYKVILNCKSEYERVYSKNGFIKNGLEMSFTL